MVKPCLPKEGDAIPAINMWIVIGIAITIFVGVTGWTDVINWEKLWGGGPTHEETLDATEYNVNEFLLKYKNVKLEICDHSVPMGINAYTKKRKLDEACIVQIAIDGGYGENDIDHAVYVREEDTPYQICTGLHVVFKEGWCGCNDTGDYYMLYATPAFDKYLESLAKKEEPRTKLLMHSERMGEETDATEDIKVVSKGETIDVNLDKLTGARKERALMSQALYEESQYFKRDVPTYVKAKAEDKKGRPMKKIGSIWMTEDIDDGEREYDFHYDNDILADHFGHIQKEVYDNLVAKLGENAAAIMEAKEEVKQKEKEGDLTMFGFTLWQIIGIVVIFIIVDRISYKLIRKSIIVCLKTMFIAVMRHVGLWKKDWDETKVGEEKPETT